MDKELYFLGDSQLSTIIKDGGSGEYTEYNHPDRLGTRLITNQTLGSSYEQAHLPFGTALAAESTGSTNKRFTSYDRSAPTGLDYAINRTYDSKQGRFTQVDPIGMQAVSFASPQTLNMYTYCGNDPINHTDPSGLFWGTFFRWLAKLFGFLKNNRVAKRIAIRFVVSLIVSGGNFGVAIRSVMPDILRQLGLNPDPLLTPSWNPGFRHPLSAGVGSLSRYIIVNLASLVRCPPKSAAATFFGNFANNAQLRVYEQAIKDTFNGPAKEQGGWVYQNAKGHVKSVLKTGEARDGTMFIYLNNPPNLRGWKVVGTFHTHIDSGTGPSGTFEDLGNGKVRVSHDYARAYERGVPEMVISRGKDGGIAYSIYGPDRGFFNVGLPAECRR